MRKNRRESPEFHCGPTCPFCRDPFWFNKDDDEPTAADIEFGPDEWGYGPDGEVVIYDV